jgi:hypothetical protein
MRFFTVFISFIIASTLAEYVTTQGAFSRDKNTDLNDEFKSIGFTTLNSPTGSSNCYTSCLFHCHTDINCMAATFSNTDQTCNLYNKTFCYGNNTLTKQSTDLYRKVIVNGLQNYFDASNQ